MEKQLNSEILFKIIFQKISHELLQNYREELKICETVEMDFGHN